jgi:hypothetical protein
MGYAPVMVRPGNAPPSASFFSGRAKWFWIAVAGALGAWLIALLTIADPVASDKAPPSPLAQPERAVTSDPTHFDGTTEKAFNRRREVRSARPLPAVPFREDDGQGK